MINFYNYHKEQLDLVDLYSSSLNQYEWCGIDENYDWNPIKHIFKCEADTAYYYAIRVLKSRWPEAEPIILKSLWYSHLYALTVIKSRWLEAEPYLMKNPFRAYSYAQEVIKDRWLEAEPFIQTEASIWTHYKRYFNIQD